ncbi:hypothetical protein CEXT_805131 [Caerostris extrusa]|uniref:Uncharacterized protein n=1 Tax=Caerostris extrusa TaxID=172846 RepID=A0AAV4PHP5_CAEEX|nr:hypothetical protein CEXT_805131 [Caerostris extrusa]
MKTKDGWLEFHVQWIRWKEFSFANYSHTKKEEIEVSSCKGLCKCGPFRSSEGNPFFSLQSSLLEVQELNPFRFILVHM